MNLRFRIYYAIWDGVAREYRYWTYEGRGFEDAIKADTEGCQLIIQENPEKEKRTDLTYKFDQIWKADVYVWRPDQGWIGMSEEGFNTYKREKGFGKYWIYGYNLLDGPFQECHRRALQEGLG